MRRILPGDATGAAALRADDRLEDLVRIVDLSVTLAVITDDRIRLDAHGGSGSSR
jgi:hypothetical protein